ncbi:hypothetical protein HAX54_047274, partial [Datura stramonium]|nr:hypothetical protein [Datura stramonium]
MLTSRARVKEREGAIRKSWCEKRGRWRCRAVVLRILVRPWWPDFVATDGYGDVVAARRGGRMGTVV